MRRDSRQRIALFVVPDAETMRRDPPDIADMRRLDAHNTDTARGTRGDMTEMPVIGDAVLRGVLAHRRHHDPVA